MRSWLKPSEVSEATGFAVGTLANWRSASTDEDPVGPPFVKVGRLVRYDSEAVAEWQLSQTVAVAS